MLNKGDTTPPSGNGWEEWKNYVLEAVRSTNEQFKEFRKEMAQDRKDTQEEIASLRRDLTTCVAQINTTIADLNTQVAVNKTKVAVISTIGGFIAGGIMSFVLALIQGLF